MAKDGAKKIEEALGGFWDTLMHLLKDLLAAFLIFVLFVFVLGELYAVYATQASNAFMLWIPVFLLLAVLAYKVLE